MGKPRRTMRRVNCKTRTITMAMQDVSAPPVKFVSSSDPFLSDQPRKITIADFGARGRGVVAAADIAAGELVERSPVLIIPESDRAACDGTIIFTYVFMWEHGTVEEDLYKHQGRAAIALG